MPWSETSPGRWTAPLSPYEQNLQNFLAPSKFHGHHHFTIGVALTLQPTGRLGPDELPRRLRQAWRRLRHSHPALAIETSSDGPPTKSYRVPSASDLNEWAKQTFVVLADPHGPDWKAAGGPRVSALPTLYYIASQHKLVFRARHWRIDLIGALCLLNQLLADALSDAAPPAAWGDEAASLRLCFDAAVDFSATDPGEAQQYVARKLSAVGAASPSTGLAYKGDATTLPGKMTNLRIAIPVDASKAIVRRCAEEGYTVSSAYQAAVALSTWAHAPPASRALSLVCLVPRDLRKTYPELSTQREYFVGCAVAGDFFALAPPPPPQQDHSFRELAEQATRAYRTEHDAAAWGASMQQFIAASHLLYDTPPPAEWPLSSAPFVDSLGCLERYLRPELEESAAGVRVTDVSLFSDIADRVVACYLFNWRGEIRVECSFNEAYYDAAFIARFAKEAIGHLAEGLGVSLEHVGLDHQLECVKA